MSHMTATIETTTEPQLLTDARAKRLRAEMGTATLSAAQIADRCHVSHDEFPRFCDLLKEAVAAGILETRQDEWRGCEVPVFCYVPGSVC
jgi:hypothetical protein